MKDVAVTCFLACIGAAMAVAAIAADATYLGTWKVTGATTAPWADPAQKADVAEQTRLIGKAVVFKTREIAGPEPLACRRRITRKRITRPTWSSRAPSKR